MQTEYRVPIYNRIVRWLFRPVFRLVFHILCRVQINGREKIPVGEPYLVAMNHVSIYEPPFILSFWPRPLEAVGAVEIWSRKGQSTLARLYGGIQVHRGQFDRQLIDQMLAAVNSGYPLLIAPEGGRTHSIGLRRGLPGAAYIAHKTDLKVVPVGIMGTSDDFFTRILAGLVGRTRRVPIEMNIGDPFYLPPVPGRGEARRQALQANTDLIMVHIGLLLPEPYHGFYADQVRQVHYIHSSGNA